MTSHSTQNTQEDRRIEQGVPVKSLKSDARFWDRVAKRYAATPVQDARAYAYKLTMTREYLTPESVVLEVGCGTGSTAIAHAPYVQHINASDFSSKMICIAKEKAAVASVRNINFVCRSVQEEITAGTCYDAILALNVLHLLKDWQEIIVSMQRLLKPGGVFVTSTPCLLNAPAWLGWIAPLGSSLGLMPQLSFFNQIELQSAFTSAGFEVVHCWQADSKYGLFLVARKS